MSKPTMVLQKGSPELVARTVLQNVLELQAGAVLSRRPDQLLPLQAQLPEGPSSLCWRTKVAVQAGAACNEQGVSDCRSIP